MRTIFYLTLIFFLFSGCCKEEDEIIEYPTLIGTWNIIQVDSCYLLSSPRIWIMLSSYQESSSMIFHKDNTGSFVDPIRSITCGEKEFSWRHNKTNDLIDFNFANGLTNGILKTFKKDTIEFYLREYCNDWFSNSTSLYYLLKLIRTE